MEPRPPRPCAAPPRHCPPGRPRSLVLGPIPRRLPHRSRPGLKFGLSKTAPLPWALRRLCPPPHKIDVTPVITQASDFRLQLLSILGVGACQSPPAVRGHLCRSLGLSAPFSHSAKTQLQARSSPPNFSFVLPPPCRGDTLALSPHPPLCYVLLSPHPHTPSC